MQDKECHRNEKLNFSFLGNTKSIFLVIDASSDFFYLGIGDTIKS